MVGSRLAGRVCPGPQSACRSCSENRGSAQAEPGCRRRFRQTARGPDGHLDVGAKRRLVSVFAAAEVGVGHDGPDGHRRRGEGNVGKGSAVRLGAGRLACGQRSFGDGVRIELVGARRPEKSPIELKSLREVGAEEAPRGVHWRRNQLGAPAGERKLPPSPARAFEGVAAPALRRCPREKRQRPVRPLRRPQAKRREPEVASTSGPRPVGSACSAATDVGANHPATSRTRPTITTGRGSTPVKARGVEPESDTAGSTPPAPPAPLRSGDHLHLGSGATCAVGSRRRRRHR